MNITICQDCRENAMNFASYILNPEYLVLGNYPGKKALLLDINDPLGGRPEERIVTEVCDSVNICVINDWTPAYVGWDTTPWDVAFG